MTSWEVCIGEVEWLLSSLQKTLHYDTPLPVQATVIPTISRAMQSNIPLDVSLTAPTGSGKTLCYLIPMLRMITLAKHALDTTQLRALILVPTKALGQQVYRELIKLTRHSGGDGGGVSVVSLCAEVESVKDEAHSLVRTVHLPSSLPDSFHHSQYHTKGNNNTNNINSLMPECEETVETETVYFSKADILIATPQRLLRHLDNTNGLSLLHLRLLVIDEADQVLAGNFANFVSKVVDRFDAEVNAQVQREYMNLRASNVLYNHDSVDTKNKHGMFIHECGVSSFNLQRRREEEYVLHKMLCSATLSSRITRISEVRLRNCRYFTLDSNGVELDKGVHGSSEMVRTTFALPPRLQEHIVFVEDHYRHAVLLKLVRTLIDRISVKLITEQEERQSISEQDDDSDDNKEDEEEEKEQEAKEDQMQYSNTSSNKQVQLNPTTTTTTTKNNNTDYPNVNDDAGSRILIFCNSADEARVMGHFLFAAGVHQVIEFTTHAQESERRRALLLSNVTSQSDEYINTNTQKLHKTKASLAQEHIKERRRRRSRRHHLTASSFTPLTTSSIMCVVASDALMRGIDLPNVGHVIMYHPPQNIAQYVHRAGRTARAHRSGHVHFLLNKNGPSGLQHDGEVAHWQKISQSLSRTLPVRYERHFFMFAAAPQNKNKNSAQIGTKTNTQELEAVNKRTMENTSETVTNKEIDSRSNIKHDAVENSEIKKEETKVPTQVTEAMEQLEQQQHTEYKEGQPHQQDEDENDKAVSATAEEDENFAEWWVNEANKYLSQSQFKLQGSWTSALQTAMQTVKRARQHKNEQSNSSTVITDNNNGRNNERQSLHSHTSSTSELNSKKVQVSHHNTNYYNKNSNNSNKRTRV